MTVGLSIQYRPTIASSNSSVTIDADGTHDFVVPDDAVSKQEPALDNSFVQGKQTTVNFRKIMMQGDSMMDMNDEGYFLYPMMDEGTVIIGQRGRNDSTAHFVSKDKLIRTDLNGGYLSNIYLSSGMSTPASSEYSWLGTNNILEMENNRYAVTYMGVAPGSTDSKQYLLSFDQNMENVKHESIEGLNGYYIDRISVQRDGTSVLAYGLSNKGANSGLEIIPIFDLNLNTKKTSVRKHLAMPSYYSIYKQPRPENWNVEVDPGTLQENDQGYTGMAWFQRYNATATLPQTKVFLVWDKAGNIIDFHAPTFDMDRKILSNSTKDVIYLLDHDATHTYVIEYDTRKNSGDARKTILTLPANSVIDILPFTEPSDARVKYVVYGYSAPTGYFEGTEQKAGLVLGFMKDDYSLINRSFIESNGKITINDGKFLKDGNIIITGFVNQQGRDFVNPPAAGWPAKTNGAVKDAFWGNLKSTKDYAPGIKFDSKKHIVNKDNIQTKAAWDQAMLEGVIVTDTFDLSAENPNSRSQQWLDERINRNPNDPFINDATSTKRLPIDWTALGLDKTKRGPQFIKYFVTDEPKQASASSRWTNIVDNDTEYDEKGALAASNYAISIHDVTTMTELEAKQMARVLAWDLIDGKVVDDGTKAKVKVDTGQLKAIQDTKAAYDQAKNASEKATIIKPYELKMTFDYAGESLERIITVFVTDDTTEVDETNGVVLYGFDFEEKLKHVKELTQNQALDLSKASAWDYHREAGEAAYLTSDIQVNLTAPFNPMMPELTGLNNVTEAGKYKVKLTYQATKNYKVTATILNNPAVIHFRGVLLGEESSLVYPEMGYLMLENTDKGSAGNTIVQTVHTKINIQEDTDTSFLADNDKMVELVPDYWGYLIRMFHNQYYEQLGYVVTKTEEIHKKEDMKKDVLYLDFSASEEYWVTLYFGPTTDHAKPYSQDYQLNDIGKITP